VTWLSFDDSYTRQKVWEGISYEARWLYHAVVEFCATTRRYDGRLRWADVLRCSDVPEPEDRAKELIQAQLLADLGADVVVPDIESFLPPAGMRAENLLPRKRANQAAWRKAKCEQGEHSRDCPASTCPAKIRRRLEREQAAAGERVTGNETGNVAGNAGTGRDGSGSANHLAVVNGEIPASARAAGAAS
jgi:hypothetical protein